MCADPTHYIAGFLKVSMWFPICSSHGASVYRQHGCWRGHRLRIRMHLGYPPNEQAFMGPTPWQPLHISQQGCLAGGKRSVRKQHQKMESRQNQRRGVETLNNSHTMQLSSGKRDHLLPAMNSGQLSPPYDLTSLLYYLTRMMDFTISRLRRAANKILDRSSCSINEGYEDTIDGSLVDRVTQRIQVQSSL